MQSSTRNDKRRKAWLTLTVALGLTAPVFAQSWDGSTVAAPGPTPSAFTPPSSTSTDQEAKSAVAANRSGIQPAGFLPPGPRKAPGVSTASPTATVLPTATPRLPVWNVAPPGGKLPDLPNQGERAPNEFGTGWKNLVNQKVLGVPPAPAAALNRPRATPVTPTARMDWNWQGYETYNQRSGDGTGLAAKPEMHPDMAPYMKYAHLWRSSNNGFVKPVLSEAGLPGSSPMPLSQNRAPVPSSWNRGSIPSPTRFASAESDKNPVQPTSFATVAPSAVEPLPQRPPQYALPAPVPRQDANVNGVPRTVRERIADVCQARAHHVVIEPIGPMRLRISFRVRQQADAELLTEQLARLRDLAPYKVDFEVQIGH